MWDSGWWQPPGLPERLRGAFVELWRPAERGSWWEWRKRLLGDPDGYDLVEGRYRV